MGLRFVKMHGLGNDYVYVDVRNQAVADPASFAQKVSNRHTGVGSDGLVIMGPSDADGAHLSMRMFNSDGSEAEMCGNAIRCVAYYAADRDWVPEETIVIDTKSGNKTTHILKDGRIRVDMGPPGLDGDAKIDQALDVNGQSVAMTYVSMGNPHAITIVNDVATAPVHELGPIIETHPSFPNATNVEFAHPADRHSINLRVWERGSGETQACGTGACATLVACSLLDLTDRKAAVHLPGGTLDIEWADDDHVWMIGPAVEVFEGVFTDAWLDKS